MGRAPCSIGVGKGQEPETAAIAVTEVGEMVPASVKHGDGKKELGKRSADSREIILLIHVVVTVEGQSLNPSGLRIILPVPELGGFVSFSKFGKRLTQASLISLSQNSWSSLAQTSVPCF